MGQKIDPYTRPLSSLSSTDQIKSSLIDDIYRLQISQRYKRDISLSRRRL